MIVIQQLQDFAEGMMDYREDAFYDGLSLKRVNN